MQQKYNMFSICMHIWVWVWDTTEMTNDVKMLLDWIEVYLVNAYQEKKELFGLNRSTKDDLSWRLTGVEGNMFCVWTQTHHNLQFLTSLVLPPPMYIFTVLPFNSMICFNEVKQSAFWDCFVWSITLQAAAWLAVKLNILQFQIFN